jgi:hypothetical protein
LAGKLGEPFLSQGLKVTSFFSRASSPKPVSLAIGRSIIILKYNSASPWQKFDGAAIQKLVRVKYPYEEFRSVFGQEEEF